MTSRTFQIMTLYYSWHYYYKLHNLKHENLRNEYLNACIFNIIGYTRTVYIIKQQTYTHIICMFNIIYVYVLFGLNN